MTLPVKCFRSQERLVTSGLDLGVALMQLGLLDFRDSSKDKKITGITYLRRAETIFANFGFLSLLKQITAIEEMK